MTKYRAKRVFIITTDVPTQRVNATSQPPKTSGGRRPAGSERPRKPATRAQLTQREPLGNPQDPENAPWKLNATGGRSDIPQGEEPEDARAAEAEPEGRGGTGAGEPPPRDILFYRGALVSGSRQKMW